MCFLSQLSVYDFPDFLIIPSDCEKFTGHLETGDKLPSGIQSDLTLSRIRFTWDFSERPKQQTNKGTQKSWRLLYMSLTQRKRFNYLNMAWKRMVLESSVHLWSSKILWSSKYKKKKLIEQKYSWVWWWGIQGSIKILPYY